MPPEIFPVYSRAGFQVNAERERQQPNRQRADSENDERKNLRKTTVSAETFLHV
ncbi:MAG TPA: hypothetical protein VGB68_12405 [Pyrinomonadaceae bacterium]